jgi:hypothetical protein
VVAVRLSRFVPLVLLALSFTVLLSSTVLPSSTVLASAVPACEVAAPEALEVGVKPGVKVAEPDAPRGSGTDLLQGKEPRR